MATVCVIPAAGKGTRMRPLTHTLPKAMLPVAGKPTIFHIIDNITPYGVKEFVIITGYLRELMEEEVSRAYPELSLRFVVQEKQLGLGHALYQAKGLIHPEDSILVVYGDTLFSADLSPILKSTIPMIGVFEVSDPSRFGIIEIDREGYITNFVEKPENPLTNLTLPGVNFFPKAKYLFEALEILIRRDIKTKNEYQATDAYGIMVKEMGIKMRYFKINTWEDAGTLEALLETNQILLNRQGNFVGGEVKNCQIYPPVYVAKGVYLENSEIGPYVSISENVEVSESRLKNVIVDKESKIFQSHLENSLIGRQVQIKKGKGKFILGDHSQVLGE